MSQAASDVDGRKLRREQNREAVIISLLALFRDGVYQPGTAEIAAKAGLSPRSLFRYFDDFDDLLRAAADRQVTLALPLTGVGAEPDDPTASKIRAVVGARAMLYEEIGPSARALRAAAPRRPALAALLVRNRAYLRGQIREVFAAELAQADRDVLPALQIMCSFEAYELLRYDQAMSADQARAALVAGIESLLGIADGPRS